MGWGTLGGVGNGQKLRGIAVDFLGFRVFRVVSQFLGRPCNLGGRLVETR